MARMLSVVLYACLCAGWVLAKVSAKDTQTFNPWMANIEGVEEVAQREARQPGSAMMDEMKWSNQQVAVKRTSNDLPQSFLRAVDSDLIKYLQREEAKPNQESRKHKKICNSIFSCNPFKFWRYIRDKRRGQGDLANLGKFSTKPFHDSNIVDTTKHIGLKSRKISAYAAMFNDPYWRKQWYVQDYRTSDGPVMDHNVVPVYRMGYTGKGVTVAVVDNGVTHKQSDLKGNFDKSLSYNMCKNIPRSEAPIGRKSKVDHGTNCAGVIAMVANNKLCGVGISYNAKVAGIKAVCHSGGTDYDLARGLVYNLEHFDIYSNSWGADDDPAEVYVPDRLYVEAYSEGVLKGRKGKGVIYTQSAGNGGDSGDNCATDGYINRPEVIAIGAVTQLGKKSDYSERCTAVFTVTYSGSTFTGFIGALEGVVATKSKGGCKSSFSGTSAATPIATGIIALALEANPELTYRDVMHLIAMSSEVAPLADNKNSWYKNGRGFWVSNDFGFGLMNAENMVTLATNNWKTVPEKRTCVISPWLFPSMEVHRSQAANITFKTTACESSPTDAVRYLEHIELASVVKFPRRGEIMVEIISPAGTRSTILERRSKDHDRDGLEGWSIMSAHNWGEDPRGKWNIEVTINPRTYIRATGYATEFTLKLHGTFDKPAHYDKPREYAAFRLPDGQTSTSS